MAKRILSFHFDYISPYSYLAWHELQRFAPEHGVQIALEPTLFAGLLNEYGHKGPAEIAPKRIYMFKDCVRIAARMNVPIAPPASHPFNPLYSLRATLLDMSDETRRELVTNLYAATWVQGREVGSPEVVAEVCAESGVPDAFSRIQEPAVKQRLLDASAKAVARGVFGVPTMIVDGELFFGTDSFGHLARYLAGGDPMTSEDVERWEAIPATARRR